MRLVQRRISDPRVLKLLKGWLKAGVMENGVYEPPDGNGTPQGGVISPLLANVYLHSLDKMFEESSLSGTWVRYVDDIVIASWGGGQHILKELRKMLARLKLELSEDKTSVVKAEDGFDFLGVHFKMIEELNPMLRGWHNYHKAVDPRKQRILKLNGYLWDRLRGFLRRKYNDDTRGCKRLRGGLLVKLGLYQFA